MLVPWRSERKRRRTCGGGHRKRLGEESANGVSRLGRGPGRETPGRLEVLAAEGEVVELPLRVVAELDLVVRDVA